MVTFEPGSFAHLTPAERRGILATLNQAVTKIQSAHERIPRTVAGVEARDLLLEAKDLLLDLYNTVKDPQ